MNTKHILYNIYMGKKMHAKKFIKLLSICICLFICMNYSGIYGYLAIRAEKASVSDSDHVKGIYVKADTASQQLDEENIKKYSDYIQALKEDNGLQLSTDGINSFEKIIALIDATRLNAVIINVKDDGGNVTIPADSEYVTQAGSYNYQLTNISKTMEQLKKHGIYVIARIVVFKDDVLAKNITHSIKYDDGTVWKDYSGSAWVDPYDEWVRQYNIEVAKQAAILGFDEIQFDYIRFPEKFSQYDISKKYLENKIRQDQLIRQFLKDAKNQLKPYDVKISADVFGCVAYLWDDPLNVDIGQVWYNLTQQVDYISPMVYPSHYRGTTWYTQKDPNKHPYEVVKGAIEDSLRINSAFSDKAGIRFWLQDFSMYGYEYGPLQILDQVQALHEKGIDTYMFWNNRNIYDPLNYLILEDKNPADTSISYYVYDIYKNTPHEAAEKFLSSEINKDMYQNFILKSIKTRPQEYMDYAKTVQWTNITDYELTGYRSSFNTSQVFFNIINKDNQQKWVLFMVLEQGLWKVNGYYCIK